MKQKLLSLGLSLALVLGLAAGCAPKAGLEESPAPETSSPVAETPPAETVAPYQTIRLGLLNGPTGMGAAKLLADSDAAFAQAEEGTYDTTEGTFFHYELTLGSDPSTDIVPKLNNGELDIAAVPTNLAATLYNKAGSIRLLALNTLGVLHILENGDTVHSMADLAGKTIYSIKHKNGAIRRVNINIAATTVDNYRLLKEAGIGTYILFQETYHKESYLELHPTGPKHDYNYHTEAMDRAMEGGIDDVGLGVLFGLDKYRYEFAGLLMHAEHLEAAFGVGPHTISVPRLKHADDIDPDQFDNGIDDDTFAKIVACIRIAVPYTGMIISTRENQKTRERVLHLGISQISGGSRTSVGGYCEPEPEDAKSEQFDVSDTRTLDEVVRWLMEMDYIPSFCTACYREGRTGDRFMSLCKSGQIQNCCHPNALMTLKEYLMDYASPETKAIGDRLIDREVLNVPNEKARAVVLENLKLIEQDNRRDFRF